MDYFIKAVSAALLAVILGIVLSKQGKDAALLITLAACAMVLMLAASYLQPIVELMRKLQELGRVDKGLLEILMKILGIGLLGEITSMVCDDAGNAAVGKTVQLLTTAVILWLTIPMIEQLLDLLQSIVGEA